MSIKPMEDNPFFTVMRMSFADEKLPKFTENKGKGIVYYGEKNNYPEKLLELFNRSPKHNAIIVQKTKLIAGKEVKVNGVVVDYWNDYDNMEEFREKIVLDKKIFGGFAVEVIYDNLKRPQFYHIDYSKIRTFDHSEYFYVKDWGKHKREDIKTYPRFNPKTAQAGDKQIYYFREYRPALDIYPLPDYVGAQQYIEVDTRIANFHLNNIASGFTAGTLVELFKGEPTPAEARKFKSKFNGEYTGDDNAGGVVVLFNAPTEKGATINNLTPNELDKQFLILNEHVQQEIFVGHRITSPMLFGVLVAGQLGGKDELDTAYELYYKNVIAPDQRAIDSVLEMFYAAQGQKVTVETVSDSLVSQDWGALYAAGLVSLKTAQEKLGLPMEVAQVAMSETNPFGWSDKDIEVFSQHGESDFEELAFDDNIDKQILGLIKDNPKITKAQIEEITRLKNVEEILTKLKADGKIKWTDKTINITDLGSGSVDDTMVVRYKYQESPEALPLLGESRPFCKHLIGLNKVYSREDIDKMSGILGYDVWKRRGGWYHNYKTDVNEPHCRHEWRQLIVRKGNLK